MGNADTKLHFRKAVVQLTTKTQPIDSGDNSFWDQFWGEHTTSSGDVFALIPAAEIRSLREEAPSNLATLCYKAVEKLVMSSDSGCSTMQEQQVVLNCVRILTRILPYIFEDPDWRGFFWSILPAREGEEEGSEGEPLPLGHSLIQALCDLLFCPDFTVSPNKKSGPDKHEDLASIDSCEYIWEAGVGFAHSPSHVPTHDSHRTELLKLILTCFSHTIYQPSPDPSEARNRWIAIFTCSDNNHALPLFTSLLNTVCGYNPSGLGVPYNHLLFWDHREPLVEVALQILITALDKDVTGLEQQSGSGGGDNLFINYLSRIHREEDFSFVLRGFTRLLNNPLQQTYLPHSSKKLTCHQELLVFFWKFCDYNKKFLFYVLKSSDVLDILVPILYHLNDARADQSRVGLMHIGVFILLLLSGERNFGVRLNKPYTASVPMDIPVFTGTHADLMIIVFHKIITTGHQRLQPLFDCLLTILVNVSPYIKTMSMVAANKLVHLLEAFSTPWFLLSAPHHHHLVFFLLETFNNIIQYQFDGNSNLVYTLIRKRSVFHALANLPTDHTTISKSLARRGKRLPPARHPSTESTRGPPTMEGATPALPAMPGTHTATLPAMPGLENMTEKESAHPTSQQLDQLTYNNTTTTTTTNTTITADEDGTPSNDTLSTLPPGITTIQPPPQPTTPSPTHLPDINHLSLTDKERRKEEEGSGVGASPTPSGQSEWSGTQGRAEGNITPTSGSGESSWVPPDPTWAPSPTWVAGWKSKLPLQTIMRLLQVLVPQVEKICIDKGLTDESEILRFLQHGTLVGLLPVPHPILIRKYQANAGTATWFRTYMWGVIYLRNVDPPIWYDTDVKLFEIQRV
ncbi:hypothetical protein Pmani_019871 [Petrolisthes manimaculis]|uniref:Protein HID1-like n=1 Tax=Petrolisthes manimaculis TaxID=1843537 RepID=A0AAE1U769_9EUCA|nr:hypothetical protein Pmani_019871 [Petrolisthes manimaculis]